MTFLNLETKVLFYSDQNIENPKVRLADIDDILQQINVVNVKSLELCVEPNENATIANTQRAISNTIDSAVFEVSRPVSSQEIFRYTWTLSPAFRTVVNIGIDSTTHVALTRVGPRSMKLQSISGTAINSALVQVGDVLSFEKNTDLFTSPFSPYNTGNTYTIQSKGSGYVIFNDEGSMAEESDVELGTSFNKAFFVYSQPTASSAKVGDQVLITSSNFNYFNQGTFPILRVAHDYIEVMNPYGVEETVTNTTNGMIVFDYFIRFVHLVATNEVSLKFDNNENGFKIDRLNSDFAQFTSSVKATKIVVSNNSLSPVAIRCQFAAIVEG